MPPTRRLISSALLAAPAILSARAALAAGRPVTVASLFGEDKPETKTWPRIGETLNRTAPGRIDLRIVGNAALGGEKEVAQGTPLSLSRTFIPAKLDDNPHLNREQYRAQLQDLDPVRKAQVEHGDWLVKPAAGLYFKRLWVRIVDAVPVNVRWRVRYWDLAAGGDWAVGVRMSLTDDGVFCVEHVVRLRGTPGEVRAAVERTAEYDGADVPIVIEQDPGQAGKDQIFSYAVWLGENGYAVYGRPKRADKITAFGPFSAQAQVRNVIVVRGAWNDAYLDVLEGFPEADHDDDVDATSGAHAVLCGAPLTDPADSGKDFYSGGKRR